MSLTGGITLAPLYVEIKGDATSLNSVMAKTTSASIAKAESVGKQLSSVGGKLTKAVTVPVLGATVACGKMAVGFETSFAKVSTLLDSGKVNYNEYKENILKNSSDMKVGVDEYSDAVYQAISASVDQSKAIDFTNQAIKLAKGGFTDATHAVDILTTAINAYGLSADDATSISDKLITTQNLGKTTVNELASSMGKVIPTANSLGLNIDNVCTAMADMTKNGIDTAEATTYFNSMLNDLGKTGTETDKTLRKISGKSFKELISSGKSMTDVLNMLNDYAKKNHKSLSDMFSTAEGGRAALVLAKNSGAEYNEILKQMSTSAGACETAFEKMDATPAEKLAGAWNKVKNSGIALGESLIPMIEKLADHIENAADWFKSLTEEQQQSIAKMVLFTAALGPVLSISGKAVGFISSLAKVIKGLGPAATIAKGATSASGVTGLVGGLSKIVPVSVPAIAAVAAVGGAMYAASEHTAYLNQSVSTTSEQLPLLQKGFNVLNGSVVKSKEEMEKLGLKYKDWSNKVSPELQKSCEDTAQKFSQLNFSVAQMADNSVKVTSEASNKLIGQTKSTCDGIINEIKKHESEGTAALKKAFASDGKKDWYEDTVIKAISKGSETCIETIKSYESQINDIYKKASDEHRSITQDEKNTIAKLYQEIGNEKIKALASSNDEYQAALANFQVRIKNLDAQGASKLLQQKAQSRDKDLKATSESYDTQIQLIKNKMAGMNAEEQKAAEVAIQQLQEQKSKKVGIINNQYREYLDTIEKEYPEMYKRINWHTGKINDVRQQKAQDALRVEESYYKDLGVITDSGYYKLYDKTTKTYEKVYAKVDSTTGRITGIWNTHTGHVEGCTEEIANSLRSMEQAYGADFYNIKKQLISAADANTKYKNNERETAKSIISDLEDVMDKQNGTYEGTLRVNGKPITVKVNKDGTIQALDSIINKQNQIKSKTVTYRVNYEYHNPKGGSGRMLMDGYIDGSHYNGLENVPYDGYIARLHKGERVLTAEENKSYSETKNSTSINFYGNYNFNNKQDIDYFFNQAALRFKSKRG